MPMPSITTIHEHDLVALLYDELRTFQHVAIPPQTPWPARAFRRVSPASLHLDPDAFGDVDALLVPGDDPELTRAIEYKRVLMPARAFATLQPNKLQELAKGVEQANRLAAAGFAFVWLSVLVAVDSRELTAPTGGYLAASREMMQSVYNALPLRDLHPSVGVTVCELTQCFDRPLQESGMLGGDLLRRASRNAQPPDLTAAIRRLVESQQRAVSDAGP